MAVDPDIQQRAEEIRNADYGREITETIAKGLELMSEDVVSNVGRQTNVETQFQAVMDAQAEIEPSGVEVGAARVDSDGVTHPNLKARLDDKEQEFTAQLAQKANKTDLANLSDATPLFADGLTGMTDTSKVYVNLVDNFVYLYNSTSTSFESTGVLYQAVGLSDKQVTVSKTDFITHEMSDNKINLDMTEEGYLSSTGIVTNSDFFTTEFIPVTLNDVIRFANDESLGSNNTLFGYDENRNFLAKINGTVDASGVYKEATISGGSYDFVRISHHVDKKNTAMLTINTPYPSEFDTFVNQYKPDAKFVFNTQQEEIIDKKTQTNQLVGKIVTFNGDSIAAGAGFDGGYGQIIATENNMVYENRAVGGGTIASGVLASDGVSTRHSIAEDISNMRADADYIILEGGVNDATLDVPLGEMSTGWDSQLDTSTFYGAVESMFKETIARYPGKKIGFVLTHYASNTLTVYFPIIREVAKKWGIPYLDLFEEVPPLRYIEHLKNAYTSNGDGVHPNEAGYRAFYVDRITAWMKSM